MRGALLSSGLVLLGSLFPGPGGTAGTASSSRAPCGRIVALAPNVVELLFALDLGDRVVGVGDHVSWPAAATELPRLGGLVDPHREEIVALDPDLSVLLPSQADLARQLREVGIDALEVESDTIEDVVATARRLGRRCGVDPGAWIRSFRRALEPRSVADGTSVLLTVGRRPGSLSGLYAAGPETFLSELLERLGAENTLADTALSYPQVNLEELLARNPDLIVELQGREISPEIRSRLRADWDRLSSLRAVRKDAIHVLAADYALVPGPRLPNLYDRLARILRGTSIPEPSRSWKTLPGEHLAPSRVWPGSAVRWAAAGLPGSGR
ncbi:MAG: helical backbone metal receptor [Thermoanaerobaculia bacterium]|nr:helical backbone metal receptor [Thermoanaerobaculia bacterium]